MTLWKYYQRWRRRQLVRKSNAYKEHYEAFWRYNEAYAWQVKWWDDYKKMAKWIYPLMALIAVTALILGQVLADAKCIFFGMGALLIIVLCIVTYRIIYRWSSELYKADQYALAKCGGLDETELETTDAE